MLPSLLKFASLLPGAIMILGGLYGTVNFLPRVYRTPDDSLAQTVLATSAAAVLWGFFQLWTSYQAFHRVHDDEEE
ncbi:MAG: hypothetical protein PHU46_15845 [Rhodocyclaceae bacterium]|nr:hypothetical protein [Rhodocyclaceae bacterium]